MVAVINGQKSVVAYSIFNAHTLCCAAFAVAMLFAAMLASRPLRKTCATFYQWMIVILAVALCAFVSAHYYHFDPKHKGISAWENTWPIWCLLGLFLVSLAILAYFRPWEASKALSAFAPLHITALVLGANWASDVLNGFAALHAGLTAATLGGDSFSDALVIFSAMLVLSYVWLAVALTLWINQMLSMEQRSARRVLAFPLQSQKNLFVLD